MRRDAMGRLNTEGRRNLCGIARLSNGKELCRRLKISPSYLSELMSGRYRPSLDLAMRIYRELGIPVVYWCIERQKPTAQQSLFGHPE